MTKARSKARRPSRGRAPAVAASRRAATRPPSQRQMQRLMERLSDAVEQMERWDGVPAEKVEADQELFIADREDLEKAIGKCIRAGLIDHPIVREWLAGRRSLGEKAWLRRFRMALERGVRPPMAKADFWLICEATPRIAAGEPLTFIQQALYREVRFTAASVRERYEALGMTDDDLREIAKRLKTKRQTFHEWLARLDLLPRPE